MSEIQQLEDRMLNKKGMSLGEAQQLVIEAYELVLGRYPDEPGLNRFCEAITSGALDGFSLYRSLLLSEEATRSTTGIEEVLYTKPRKKSPAALSINNEDFVLIAKANKIAFIDIQDLVNFLQSHNSVTGIQRVICGIVKVALSDLKGNGKTFFSMIGSQSGEVLVFDERALLYVVDLAMDGGADQKVLRELVITVKKSAQTVKVKAGDVYFIGGAYWIVPDFGRKLNSLRQKGVRIGTYIYDLIPITSPQWVTDETRLAVTDRAIDILLLSDFFFTISKFVQGEVAALLDAEFSIKKTVTCVPLPHNLPAKSIEEKSANDRILGLDRFVLCVCTLEGRKNHMLLFRIWTAMIRNIGYDNVPALVLVGKWGWNIDRFRQACLDSEYLKGKIIIFENIGDQDLAQLYRRCEFTIFPSFVEGWGLPVGESLSFGKFCIASRSSSIPEVGGEFCEYFDPNDLNSALKAVTQFISDPELLSRKTLAVCQFVPRTWHEYVENLFREIELEGEGDVLTERRPISYEIVPNKRYEISAAALVKDDTLGWSSKALKFCLSDGWGCLEDWGAWANQPCALLKFKCSLSSEIVMHLELRSPKFVSGGAQVSIRSNNTLLCRRLVAQETKWVSFRIKPDVNGECAITLYSDFTPLTEPDRHLFVGMSGVAFVEAYPSSDQARAIEFASTLASRI